MTKPQKMLKNIQAKIQNWNQILQTLKKWRQEGEKIVFTNGCFDLLHYGHIHYLAQASELGSKLIIGLNSSSSVKRLKGKHRPIKDEKTRQIILAAFQFVDAVVLFDQDTPLELIALIIPEVLVKGGDWKPEEIVGSEVVLNHAGIVKSLPFIEGYSSSALEAKIRN